MKPSLAGFFPCRTKAGPAPRGRFAPKELSAQVLRFAAPEAGPSSFRSP
jgi:hypothetical protein